MGARAAHRGRLHAALGELDLAIEELERGREMDRRLGAVVFEVRDGLDLADALMRRGGEADRQRALNLIEQLLPVATSKSLKADQLRAENLLGQLARNPRAPSVRNTVMSPGATTGLLSSWVGWCRRSSL